MPAGPEANLFDFFDRPSSETPEILLDRLGEQGLANLQSDLKVKEIDTQNEIDRLKADLAVQQAELQSIRADQSITAQAQQLGRDRGLE